MKKHFVLSVFCLALMSVSGQGVKPLKVNLDTIPAHTLRQAANKAFDIGEELRYVIHYGWIDAGEAVLRVKESPLKFNQRSCYHIVGEGNSLGAFDWFFKVRDRYESYLDKEGMFPHRFVRNCDEGGYKINQTYNFVAEKDAVKNLKGEVYATPAYIQDMLSSFYYARNLDFRNIKAGDIFEIPTFVDDEIYSLKIKYIKKENIKVKAGTYRCYKFVPLLQEGRIFENEEDLSVWISADGNRIPVLVKSKILVGSIKMELTSSKHLVNATAKLD